MFRSSDLVVPLLKLAEDCISELSICFSFAAIGSAYVLLCPDALTLVCLCRCSRPAEDRELLGYLARLFAEFASVFSSITADHAPVHRSVRGALEKLSLTLMSLVTKSVQSQEALAAPAKTTAMDVVDFKDDEFLDTFGFGSTSAAGAAASPASRAPSAQTQAAVADQSALCCVVLG